MNNLKNRSIAGAAALVATFVTVAMATPLQAEPVAVKVAYSDLDVGSPAGAQSLRFRIRGAATQACGYRDIANQIQVDHCRRRAIATAQDQILASSASAGVRTAAR